MGQTTISQLFLPFLLLNPLHKPIMAVKTVARRAASKPRAAKRAAKKRAARKAKKITKAKQTGSYRQVWNGTKTYTKGGLVKSQLCLNKRGKVVSKKQNSNGKKKFKSSGLAKWTKACAKARAELGLTGFVACKKGTKFYKLAKSYYN